MFMYDDHAGFKALASLLDILRSSKNHGTFRFLLGLRNEPQVGLWRELFWNLACELVCDSVPIGVIWAILSCIIQIYHSWILPSKDATKPSGFLKRKGLIFLFWLVSCLNCNNSPFWGHLSWCYYCWACDAEFFDESTDHSRIIVLGFPMLH